MDRAADSSLSLSRVECKVWTADCGAALDNTDLTDETMLACSSSSSQRHSLTPTDTVARLWGLQ